MSLNTFNTRELLERLDNYLSKDPTEVQPPLQLSYPEVVRIWALLGVEKVLRPTAGWETLADLPEGAVFETKNGIRAIKIEHHYPDGTCQSVLLDGGAYAYFPEKNNTLVRKISIL